MDTSTASDLLRNLNPDEIRDRLTEIDGERRALMTLLRAALAKRTRGADARSQERQSTGEGKPR